MSYDKKINIAAVTILVIAAFLAVASVWNDSPVVDEIPHIGAGYSYVTKGDYRLNPEHPPLAKDLAGLAIMPFVTSQTSFQTQFWTKDVNGQWNFGRNLIYNSGNDALLLVRAAKIPMILLFLACGLIIFIWTKKLYNSRAALIALFLFCLSPTVLAHGRLVTTDMAALFGVLLSSFFFIKFLKEQNKKNFWLAAVTFGISQLTKFSLFLLNPLFIIVALIWGFLDKKIIKTLGRTILIIAVGYLIIVWPIYYLHTFNYPPDRQRADTAFSLASYSNRSIADIVVWMSDKPVIRALAQYGQGLVMVSQRAAGGNTAYFLGVVRVEAWKKYFPIVYFIKEPLAFWALVLITLVFLASRLRLSNLRFIKIKLWARDHFAEVAMLLWLLIYWTTSIISNLNIGIRHLMPVYGFTYILVSGQIAAILEKIKSKKALIASTIILAALLGWYMEENLNVFPYYLTYFNQVVGGPANGYKYVVDSNDDWGQDLKRLADWVNQNNIPKINLDYFGWADPTYYLKDKFVWTTAGIYKNKEDFLRSYPKGGYLAISANFYMNSRAYSNNYLWLESYKPVAYIGNSIFVWHFVP